MSQPPLPKDEQPRVVERITGRPAGAEKSVHFRAIPLLRELTGQVLWLWDRTKQLDMRSRRLATIAALATLGVEDELSIHVGAALGNGELTADELAELAAHLTTYIGWPRVRTLGAVIHQATQAGPQAGGV